MVWTVSRILLRPTFTAQRMVHRKTTPDQWQDLGKGDFRGMMRDNQGELKTPAPFYKPVIGTQPTHRAIG
jgi:hypothetical protein